MSAGWYLCSKPVRRKADLGSPGDGSPPVESGVKALVEGLGD